MKLDVRETGTVLAALRHWQHRAEPYWAQAYADIATDGGQFEPLSNEEIDALCDKINFGE